MGIMKCLGVLLVEGLMATKVVCDICGKETSNGKFRLGDTARPSGNTDFRISVEVYTRYPSPTKADICLECLPKLLQEVVVWK